MLCGRYVDVGFVGEASVPSVTATLERASEMLVFFVFFLVGGVLVNGAKIAFKVVECGERGGGRGEGRERGIIRRRDDGLKGTGLLVSRQRYVSLPTILDRHILFAGCY